MNKQTSPDKDNFKNTQLNQDETIDDIMASIMESISKDSPSPLDGERKALIEQADPLDYDIYRYDDKPAVILGAGASPAPSAGSAFIDDLNHQPSGSMHDSQREEPAALDEPETLAEIDGSGAPAAPSISAEPLEVLDVQVHSAEELHPKDNQGFIDLASPEAFGEASYSTAEFDAIKAQPAAPVMSIEQTAPGSFVPGEPEITKSIPFIPVQEGKEGADRYQVAFDFGDSGPSKLITVLPVILHIFAGIAVAAWIFLSFGKPGAQEAVSPLVGEPFTLVIMALAVLIIVGVLLGIILGFLARATARNKRGWITSILARFAFSSFICVVLWAVAVFVSDALAQGRLTL